MNLLRRSFSALRTWLGLNDASDDHATPSHGWLLPGPEAVAELAQVEASAPAQTRLQ
jgi:hypothetical protein